VTPHPKFTPQGAHKCARQACGEWVRQWTDQVIVDVVSTGGTHQLHWHVECWKEEGGYVEPMPGVTLHIRRPTLHPTMRHRRTNGHFGSPPPDQAVVVSLQDRGQLVTSS
jgi:hypothetical protein